MGVVARTEQSITVTRLNMTEVEENADDLHNELRAWAASSTLAGRDHHDADLAMMVENATFNERIEFRIATLAGRRAGIAVTRESALKGEPSTFVWWLVVDPAARRRGIARALAQDIEQGAATSTRHIHGHVDGLDAVAVGFWTSLGWGPAGPDPKAVWVYDLSGVPGCMESAEQ
jgi:GNAT superfamily N-acetyltransferase